jgi:serine/threonine protein kinase
MKLKSPNLVKIFKYFQEGRYLCIVMEFFEDGVTLTDKIQEQSSKGIPFEETFIFDIFIQLASALYECRKHEVYHRGLKPDNILINKEGFVKFTHFGIRPLIDYAYQEDSNFSDNASYTAPEVFDGQPYSYVSDVWSLGCIINQLMTLKHRFNASDLNSFVNIITEERNGPLTGKYNKELETIVVKMLLLEIGKRSTIQEVCEVLFHQVIENLKSPKVTYSGEQLFRFGNALEFGYLGKSNLKEAIKYYKMSSDLGNSHGMLNYGRCLEKSFLGEPNLKEAINYYKKVSDLGDSIGMNNYKRLLSLGN